MLLHFGAVDYACEVYVNGRFVGRHAGGYLPFSADVTDWLQEENTLTVRVTDSLINTPHAFGRPAAAVDNAKKKRLIAAAEEYLRRNREETEGLQPRIDVIEVYIMPESEKYKVLKIVHMENAVRRS